MKTLTKKEAILQCLNNYREEIEKDIIKHKDNERYILYAKGQLNTLNIALTFIDIVL